MLNYNKGLSIIVSPSFPIYERIFLHEKEAEKAILVGVALQSENISYDMMCEYLDELAFLAETAGAETVKIFTQNLDKPVTATFVGKGKLEEIKTYVEDNDIDLIILMMN